MATSVVQRRTADLAKNRLEDGSEAIFESEAGDWREDGPGLVGSLVWTLRRGDRWVLGPEAAFLFKHCWRKTLIREASHAGPA